MKQKWSVKQPHVKAKILGAIFIILGIAFITLESALYLKIGLGCILLGLFSIIMISEKTIPERIGNTQIQGPSNAIIQLITQLNLKGNAVFLPQNSIRTEERVFIPLKNNDKPYLSDINDEIVFTTGSNNTSLGIALPPSGLPLLHEIEKETIFENTTLDQLEEKLQTFVARDIVKSISLKEKNKKLQLQLEKPLYCTNDARFCNQYPCPTCSAALTSISKATGKKIRIIKTKHEDKKTIFHIDFLE